MASIPFTLLLYISRVFLFHLFVISTSISVLCFLGILTENARRLIDHNITSYEFILKMSFLQTPGLVEMAFPLIFLIASMSCFFSLTRHHELDAARTGGVSAWMFISPALLIALLFGAFIFGVYNPASATLSAEHRELTTIHIRKKANLFALSDTGIWLKQGNEQKQSIIHASRANPKGDVLFNTTMFLYEEQDRFTGRIDAQYAELKQGRWVFHDVWITSAEGHTHFSETHEETTTLTPEHVYDSVAPPETIPSWSLSRFITLAKAAGLAVPAYEFQWYMLLTMPFFLLAMVFVGASAAFFFSARQNREVWLVISTILFGFAVYTLIFIGRKLAPTLELPILLLVSAPILFTFCSGLFLFLQKEEG